MLPETLSSMNITRDDVNCFITHQIGDVHWQGMSRFLGFKKSIMTKTFDVLGNITTSTFSVNYAMALEENQIKPGDLVLAAMSGSGISTCQAAIIV